MTNAISKGVIKVPGRVAKKPTARRFTSFRKACNLAEQTGPGYVVVMSHSGLYRVKDIGMGGR